MRMPLAIIMFVVTSAIHFQSHASDLDSETFSRLHAELKPSDSEPWRTIPWMIDLVQAQQAAAEQKKAIFIWAMDGHPLGCT